MEQFFYNKGFLQGGVYKADDEYLLLISCGSALVEMQLLLLPKGLSPFIPSCSVAPVLYLHLLPEGLS